MTRDLKRNENERLVALETFFFEKFQQNPLAKPPFSANLKLRTVRNLHKSGRRVIFLFFHFPKIPI